MSTLFGAFVRSNDKTFVKSPLFARNPTCGYFPNIPHAFSITLNFKTFYSTFAEKYIITGDGYPGFNNATGFIPTIPLAPGLYDGSWSFSTNNRNTGWQIHCIQQPIKNINDFGWYEQPGTHEWECFPLFAHTPRFYGDKAIRQWGPGGASAPESGSYRWLSGSQVSYYYDYFRQHGLDTSQLDKQRYRCPFRVWIRIDYGEGSGLAGTSDPSLDAITEATFTLSGHRYPS